MTDIRLNKKIPRLRFAPYSEHCITKKLGDVANVKTGPFGSLLHEKDYVEEGTPIITVEHLSELGVVHEKLPHVSREDKERLRSFTLESNDIVFSRVGSVDRNSIVSKKENGWLFSGRLLRIRCKEKILVPKYLSYHFQLELTKYRIRSVAVGQTMPSLNTEILKSFHILFPLSIPEQKKIASFLSAVDRKIQQLTRKKELLEQYKRGVMQKIFSREIRFKDENGKDYPDWEEKRLGELINKMQSGISRKLSDLDIGLPILRSNNLVNGKLDVSEIKYWYLKDNQGVNLENYLLKDKDLLVNFINSTAQIGKVAMFKNLLQRDTIFTTNLMRLSFKKSIDHYYVYYYFQLKAYVDYIQSITKPAVNQASFTTKDFQNFKLLIPDILEQKKIANCLSNIDKKIEFIETKLTQTQTFKKGLLQQMFI